MSIVCRPVNSIQQEVSIVSVLMLDETLADMLKIPIGTKSGKLLEVTAKNHDGAVGKLPNRIPETAELLVVVLGDLVADEEVIPVQQKKTQTHKQERQVWQLRRSCKCTKNTEPPKLKLKKPSLGKRKSQTRNMATEIKERRMT